MAQDTRSLEEIKRDTERARAGLTQTVDQLRSSVTETASDLRERISPDAIKAEVSDYFKSRGEALMENVSNAARNNPVQALAVGATLAYPMLRLVRAIPVPVLMVGAGLYLAGSKTGQALTQKASDAAVDLAGDVERRTRDFRADAADTAAAAGQYVSSTMQAAGDALHTATDAASSRADQFRQAAAAGAADLKDKADEFGKNLSTGVDDLRRRANAAGEAFATESGEIANKGAGLTDAVAGSIRDTAASIRDTAASARDRAADAASRLRSTIGDTADAGREAALKARDRAAELSDQAGKTVVEAIGKNPLLVAGIGLVIGGLIASAIPRFRLEKEWVGNAADELKSRARETLAQGVETVKEATSAAFEQAARTADNEGLSKDSVSGTVSDLGQRARKVAEAAAASFETPSQNKH
jgi:hypothetical protein